MPIPRWLQTYWQERFAPVLADTEVQKHPERLQELFEQAVQEWRAKPKVRSPNTIATYVTLTRDWLRSLPLTPTNRVHNPVTGQDEHIALAYWTLTPEEWAEGKQQTHGRVEARNERIIELAEPERLLERIEQVLAREEWEALAAGIAVVSGRRVGEVLLSGSIEPKTAYSVWFQGRLKMRGRPDQQIEVPTLCEAERVINVWERLRLHPTLAIMDLPGTVNTRTLGLLNARLYPRVRAAADHFFGDLVPALDEQGTPAEVSTHRLRSVYAALASWLYCPSWVDPDRFAAAVLGHGLFSKDGVEQLNPSTEEYYHRYVVGDGRRGVWLDKPGVVILERFQRPSTSSEPQTEPQGVEQAVKPSRKSRHEPARKTKTGYSSLRPKVETRWEIYLIAKALGIEWKPDDEVLQELIKTYHAHQTCLQAQAEPVKQEPTITPEGLGLDEQETARALQAMQLSQQPTLAAFVKQAVERESLRVVNLAKTVQEKRKQGEQGLADVPTSQLEHVRRAPEANERLRRAIATIIDFNRRCPDPNQFWYINQKLLRDFTGAAPGYINRMLEANQEYLTRHHTHLNITPAHNRIPTKKPIRESLQIPEQAAELSSLTDLVVPPLSPPQS